MLAAQGRIDVLVNDAGYGSYGAPKHVPMSEARSQIEVNPFGSAHLTRAVLPAMRTQHSGTIIDISSLGGRDVRAGQGGWIRPTSGAPRLGPLCT
ncbi:SDR family NAD(P)-dependent oxidoreductase [Nonomuraea sp. NPDC050153]|uniref:SDR family NAD(P)-dependent oxidoreductase n=1 Tax=Nonomuraea sp. NPDC050153 TaxID=3364359 RepID=UPI00378ABE5F